VTPRRPAWFDAREEGLARRLRLAPLVPLSWLYGLGALVARRLRTASFRTPVRLSCHVISVGNLVVGGSGKTPFAAWLAARLRERGHKVALASRGYGRTGRDAVRVVSDGRFVRATVAEAGDEPLLLAAHAPGVPVLVGANRALVGLRGISAFGIDALVLDDGLQHTRLARDVEIVTFDGAGGLGNGRLMPRGPLREPLSVLGLVDAVVVVDGPLPARDRERIAARAPAARWFAARRRIQAVRPLAGGRGEAPEGLSGLSVGILAGIAQPDSLRRSVEALGARVVATRRFPDHHRYRARDLRDLAAGPSLWVTTEKDAVKISPSWVAGVDLRVLVARLEVERGVELLDWLEETLRRKRRYDRS
jgi:tetraacyldisaccharide 4'-kinase